MPTPYVAPLHALDSESSETILETTPLVHSTSHHTGNTQPLGTNVYGACADEEEEEIGSTPLATLSHPQLSYHGQRTDDDSLLQDCWNKTMDIVVVSLVLSKVLRAQISITGMPCCPCADGRLHLPPRMKGYSFLIRDHSLPYDTPL